MKKRVTEIPLIELDVQIASQAKHTPNQDEFLRWAQAALEHRGNQASEISIRIVDEDESQTLNNEYRGKDKPTNVLSFPADLPEELNLPLLGDLVICAPIVEKEATEQQKSLQAHWAHMTIHGILHLIGYDHIEDGEAEEMESLESRLLSSLGYKNPYV